MIARPLLQCFYIRIVDLKKEDKRNKINIVEYKWNNILDFLELK